MKLEPYESTLPLLGIVSNILHRGLLANVCYTMHDVKACSQSMHPSTDKKIMKTCHIHRMEFHLALKKQIMSSEGKRYNWRSSHHIKGNKTIKDSYCFLLFVDSGFIYIYITSFYKKIQHDQ